MKEVKELAKQYMDEMMDGSVSLTTIKDEPITIEVRFKGLSTCARIGKRLIGNNTEKWYVKLYYESTPSGERDFNNPPPLSCVIQMTATAELESRTMEVSNELR